MNTLRLTYPLLLLCRVLGVSRSGYYAWFMRPPSKRAREEGRLEIEIKAAHKRTRETCGPERLQADLAAHDVKVGVLRIRRIRKKLGLRCKQVKKFKATTDSNHTRPVAENLLGQQFSATAPNQVWVSDLSYMPTDEGWLYCAAHKDLFNGEIVGYALKIENHHEPGHTVTLPGSKSQTPSPGPHSSFRSRKPVLLSSLPEDSPSVRHDGLDEQKRQLLRQRPYGELLGHAEV
jgi:transposase InsO family protein